MRAILTCITAAAVVLVITNTGLAEIPTVTVLGVVTDEHGNPLEDVIVRVCGIEWFEDEHWGRKPRSGEMGLQMTDNDGRFAFEFTEAGIRFDIYLEKDGFGPAFLYGITSTSDEIEVVLTHPVLVTGTVTRLVAGRMKPVEGVKVKLWGPTNESVYELASVTDYKGRYKFPASAAPEGRKWSVLFLNEGVDIDIGEDGPVEGPDFVVQLTVNDN